MAGGVSSMDCKYKKFTVCTQTCKWFFNGECLLLVIERKMTPEALLEFKNAIDLDNRFPLNSCIHCDTQLYSHIHIFKRSEEIYQIFCPSCHLRGPKGSTVMEAITNYNALSAREIG